MIEVRHLRYFIAVAEELHFGRAAERLHMAQSPLSHQIRQLERRLGVVLLDRDHHVVGLTDAGRTFLHEARLLLQELDGAVERTQRAGRGEVGTIRVGFVAEATAELLPRSLRAHRAEWPEIEIEPFPGTTGQLIALLAERTLDVAFVRSPGAVDELQYEALVHEPLLLAVPAGLPSMVGDRPQPSGVDDLPARGFIVPSYDSARGLRLDIDSATARVGIRPNVIREARSITAVVLLVAAGVGAALVPASVAHSYSVKGVHFMATDSPSMTSIGICWRRGAGSEVLNRFIHTTCRTVECPATG